MTEHDWIALSLMAVIALSWLVLSCGMIVGMLLGKFIEWVVNK